MPRITKEFLNQIQGTTKSIVKRKEKEDWVLTTPEEKDSLMDTEGPWFKHYSKEVKKPFREREFFVYKQAHVVRVLFKAIEKGGSIINKPSKNESNDNWRMWGVNFPLLGKYNSNQIFLSEELYKQGIRDKVFRFNAEALLRGVISTKYKPIKDKNGNEYTGYAMNYYKFIEYMNVDDIKDVNKGEYYREYILNLWEIVGRL